MIEVRFKLNESDGMMYELFQLVDKKARNEFVKESIINSLRAIRDKQCESNYITSEKLEQHGFKSNINKNNITLGVEDLFSLIQKTTSTSQPVAAPVTTVTQTEIKETITPVQVDTIEIKDTDTDEPFINDLDGSIDMGF